MQAHLCCVVSLLRCCAACSLPISFTGCQWAKWIALLLVRKSSLFTVVLLFFHHLNIFCTSGCVLWPGVVVSPLSLPSYRDLMRTKRGTCRRIRKLYVNSYTSIVNIRTYTHTYKHSLRLRPHKRPPCPHDYVPHTKAFGNKHISMLRAKTSP